MSKYFYKGTSINNFFTTPWSSQTTTTMSQVYTNGISTGRSNYLIERFNGSQIGYQINGTDVTGYACPTYSEYGGSTSATVPSWASAITIVCISGGGGGGAGTNGFKKNQPLQGKGSQNGGGGGGGGGGEYKIFRGYPVAGGTPLQIVVGGGGGGGQGPSADGGGGGETYVKLTNSGVIVHTAGGNGGQGGALGGTGGGGGGKAYNTYYAENYNNGSTYGTGSNGGVSGNQQRENRAGGNINQPQGDYLPLGGQFSGGGTGGMGSNYEDQGRANGGNGSQGFVRIYWLA